LKAVGRYANIIEEEMAETREPAQNDDANETIATTLTKQGAREKVIRGGTMTQQLPDWRNCCEVWRIMPSRLTLLLRMPARTSQAHH